MYLLTRASIIATGLVLAACGGATDEAPPEEQEQEQIDTSGSENAVDRGPGDDTVMPVDGNE